MQGELPQEQSVAVLEALGTGTGHAAIKKHTVFSSIRFSLCCPPSTPASKKVAYSHFLMVDVGSRKGWLKNVSEERDGIRTAIF